MILIKSVQMNAKLWLTVKSVESISLLEKLSRMLSKFHNGVTYRAFLLVAYFGFFRLASLVPNSVDIQCLGMSFGTPWRSFDINLC